MRFRGQNGRVLATYCTPSPRVTATGVNSAGPIGRAQTGIDFCPRMGDGRAYLEVYTPRSQSSEKDLRNAPVTVRISMVSEGVASKPKMSFSDPDVFGVFEPGIANTKPSMRNGTSE